MARDSLPTTVVFPSKRGKAVAIGTNVNNMKIRTQARTAVEEYPNAMYLSEPTDASRMDMALIG